MLKRVLALCLTMVLILGLAVGCTNAGDPPQGNTDADPPKTDATETPPETNTDPKTEDGKKEMVYGQTGMKAVLDRTIVTYIETGQITGQVFEGLLYNNPFTGQLEPRLATGFADVSADNLEYTFTLKQGVKWHDGTEFTTDDVLFTFERIFTPATGSLVVEDYIMIKGAQEMLDGAADTIEGMEIIDEYTFKVTILEPFALFETFFGTCPLYPRAATTAAGDDWGVHTIIGTGPFMLDSHDMDEGARLVRNDNYHDAAKIPKLDSIYFKFYQDPNTMLLDYEAGNVDSILLDASFVDQYQDDSKFGSQLNYFPTFGHFFVIMNFDMEPWKDNPKAREAFSYAVDVDSIANDLFDGMYIPSACLLAPTVMGHDASVPMKEYDPEKAKALLKEAGYENGVDITFTTTSLEGAGGKMIIAMQETAAAAGFRITPEQVDRAVWTDIRNNGQVQTFVANWYLGLPDADGMLHGFFHSGNNKFFSSMYVNAEYDSMVEEARRTLDDAARAEIYRQADVKLVQEDFVTIPLAWPVTFYMAQPWLKDFETANSTPNFSVVDMDVSQLPASRQ